MNAFTKVLLIFTAVIACSFMISQKKKIIFFGDSITEAGVNPGGYITMMNEIIKNSSAAGNYELKGAGIGGNKIYDLYLRMDQDVLAAKPDIVVIWVGVNDVWHKQSHGTGTDPDKFERFYLAVIKKLKEQNIKPVLCTPAVIGERTDFSNELDGDLNRYSIMIRRMAQEQGLPLIDLRKTFLDHNLKNNSDNKEAGILTTDRVHLNEKGNRLVAEKMWEVLKNL
ncbi:MAG: SGNH/GDSL hydrolase family protein [Cyclobacteriaceae bacterium]